MAAASRNSGSLSKSTGFYEIFDKKGKLLKSKLKFGKNKEVCLNTFQDLVYVHISDTSKCYEGGRFNFQKIKSVSLKYDDLETLFKNYTTLDYYRGKLTQDTLPPPQEEEGEEEEDVWESVQDHVDPASQGPSQLPGPSQPAPQRRKVIYSRQRSEQEEEDVGDMLAPPKKHLKKQ